MVNVCYTMALSKHTNAAVYAINLTAMDLLPILFLYFITQQ